MTVEEAFRVATTANAGTRIGDATVLRKGVENDCFVLWLDVGGCISVPNAVAVLTHVAPPPPARLDPEIVALIERVGVVGSSLDGAPTEELEG